MRITCSFVSALDSSTESFDGHAIGIIARVVRARSGFGNNNSVLVKNHGENNKSEQIRKGPE